MRTRRSRGFTPRSVRRRRKWAFAKIILPSSNSQVFNDREEAEVAGKNQAVQKNRLPQHQFRYGSLRTKSKIGEKTGPIRVPSGSFSANK